VVVDLSQPLENADRALIARAESAGRRLVVGNKADLAHEETAAVAVAVSALTGEGLDTLNSSTVSYGPASNPSLYTGSVVQLSGDQLSLSVTSTAAAPADLLLNLNLQLNQSAGTVTGQLSAR